MNINNLEINSDIYEILDKLFMELQGTNYFQLGYKEAGEYLLVQCPYHKNGQEHHPSAQFRKSDGLFLCHNCKESHPLYTVISDCLHTNGIQWLKDNFNTTENKKQSNINKIIIDNKKQYISDSILDYYNQKHPYMYERKLTDEIIEKFNIGYDKDNNCITFPNRDINGKILFIATRNVDNKYFHYPKEVDKPVYGLYEIYREIINGKDIKEVYICESMLDALFIWTCGKYAVALNGTGSAHQYDILNKTPFYSFILATDNDSAGKDARSKLNANLNKYIKEIDYKSYGNCKDINDMTKEQFLNANIISYKHSIPKPIVSELTDEEKALQNELVRAINRMSPYWQKQNDVDDNISTIIYNANTIEDLQECPDMNYALHRWYNFKTSKFYENVFAACGAIPEQNEKNKEIDFYLDGIPYDLKVTIFPNALRKKAYLYDMTRRQGKNNLIKWLYKNQSNEGRHHNANRIFIVCDEQSIEKSLILKCRFDIIKPKIIAFVNYTKKKGHNNILINNKKVYSDIIYIKL